MVVKMRKWSPWQPSPSPPAATSRKFLVKAKSFKLKGLIFDDENNDDRHKEAVEDNNKDSKKHRRIARIKMKWKGEPRFRLMPLFHRTLKQKRDFTSVKILKQNDHADSIEWNNNSEDGDDQLQNICCFTQLPSSDHHHQKLEQWDVSFHVLYGEKMDSKRTNKLAAIGRVSLNIAELAAEMKSEVERELPINLQIDGVVRQAALTVILNLVEMRDAPDSAKPNEAIKASTGSGEDEEIVKRRNKRSSIGSQEELLNLDESNTKSSSYQTETNKLPDLDRKLRWLSWSSRHFSFKPPKIKQEENAENAVDADLKSTTISIQVEDEIGPCDDDEQQRTTSSPWELKELVSRDGLTKLKASIFFASFDQCSDKAAGESACTALVAVISHWLQSNPNTMPNKSEFDNLIVEGSSEWRKLCDNATYVNDFPNKHFDLETVLKAEIRPIAISHAKSYVGFFGAERFESLKGFMSFDELWNEISSNVTADCEPRTYIISWNDHFFVLKAEANAYYIIDTLGERLFEGCNQAYILKFDDSALMRGQEEGEECPSQQEMTEEDGNKTKEENEEIICSGKECCREFVKRFLAAIPLKELEEEEKKKAVSYVSLHQRLQIEFNFTYSLSSSHSSLTTSPSSSPDTSTSSPFSSEGSD